MCRLGLRAVSRHLDVLSYENVNDPRTRSELRAARGFCNWHAWQFAEEIHDGLGTAIIYRDIIGELLDVLGARRQRGRRAGALTRAPDFQALAQRLAPQQECPACRCLRQSSGRYLDTLIAQIPEAGFRARYLASDGLCLPHLLTGLRNLVGPYRGFLTQAPANAWRRWLVLWIQATGLPAARASRRASAKQVLLSSRPRTGQNQWLPVTRETRQHLRRRALRRAARSVGRLAPP